MRTIFKELRLTLALALPMIVGQVSQMLIGLSDNAFIGRIGTVELAAAAFTHSIFGLFYLVGIGLLLPVAVLTARDHGAGNEAGCAAWLRHGKALAFAVGCAAFGLLAIVSTQLHRFGQPLEVVAVMKPFFLLIGASLVPVLYFQVQRQYLDALGRPWVGTSIMLADIGLNALLNWVFIWGHLGAPALGLTGSGVATFIARLLAVGLIGLWLRRTQKLKAVGRGRRTPPALGQQAGCGDPALQPNRWERARFREMLAIGVPAAGCLLFESGAFGTAALMMGWLGAVALAAHQIALSCAALTFMVPLGLSMATSIRISRALGEGRNELLRPIGFGALGFASVFMVVFAAVFLTGGVLLARGFTADEAVITLAAQLLAVAALFQLVDGGQVVASGALRGLTDVKVPTVITFIAYWLVSLPVAYLLAFRGGFGPIGVWLGLASGLFSAAVLLVWRLHRKTATGSM